MKYDFRVIGTVRVERYRIGEKIGDVLIATPIEILVARNLVTGVGQEHYAQRFVGGSPLDNSFDAMVLFEGVITPSVNDTLASAGDMVDGSLKRFTPGYPRNDDPEPSNAAEAGPNVVTYQCTYGAAEGNANAITGIVITNYAQGAPGVTEPLLMHARVPAFSKTSSDQIKISINHKVLGA